MFITVAATESFWLIFYGFTCNWMSWLSDFIGVWQTPKKNNEQQFNKNVDEQSGAEIDIWA